MSPIASAARLGLVDPSTASPAVSKAFAKLPVINVFRAMANAESLYPVFIDFRSLLFQRSLEIDTALVRMSRIVGRVFLCLAAECRRGPQRRRHGGTDRRPGTGRHSGEMFFPRTTSGLRLHGRSSVHAGSNGWYLRASEGALF